MTKDSTDDFNPCFDSTYVRAMTSFNLAPRGFGRASFRLAEIVQLGRIPVYLYDDYPWLPYTGSNVSLSEIGFVGRLGHFQEVFTSIRKFSTEDIIAKLQKVKLARHAYTYAGVMDEIDRFFHDPLGNNGGSLACYTIPSTLFSVLDINL